MGPPAPHAEPAPALPVALAWRRLRRLFPSPSPHGLWLPDEPGAPRWAFAGEARRIEARGAARFDALHPGALSLPRPAPDGAPLPRYFGGFAFRAASEPHPSRPDLCFVWPAAAYVRTEERSWLLVAGEAGLRRLPSLRAVLREPVPPSPPSPPPTPFGGLLRLEPEPRWRTRLRSALAALRAERLRKLVSGRWAFARLAAPMDPERTLARLPEGRGVRRFLLGREGHWLAGASPERLLSLRRGVLLLDALAGTASPQGHFTEKDVEEHEAVVRLACEDLAALGISPRRQAPRVVRRGPLKHLWTPLRASLPSAAGPWLPRLLNALHPTAATCGSPREDAFRWIAEHEPDRGWMAGAVGWLDATGEAELAVALRTVWVEGDRARWWSGAGLLADSEADAEHREVLRKLSVGARALGLNLEAPS